MGSARPTNRRPALRSARQGSSAAKVRPRPSAWWVAPTLVLLALACQPAAAPPSTPINQIAAAAEPTASPRPFGGLPVQDPFPAATTTVANGQALLWSPWPMEGRDPQRTGRSPSVGVAQPRLIWSADIDPPSFGQSISWSDGSMYVGTATGRLVSYSPTGSPSWSFSATGPLTTPAVGPDGTVYVRAGDGTLFALHPDGRRRWTTDIGAPPSMLGPAPVVGPDNYGYLTSYHSSMVYLVQPGGFFQWAYNARARTLGGAAVGTDGLIYFGTADGKLRSMDRELVERWVFDVGSPVISSPALGPDGSIYVLTEHGLLAVAHEGRQLWSIPSCWQNGAPAMWPSVALDGRVQVANCAVGRDGKILWQAPTHGPWTTPAALDSDGNAYFGSGSVLTSVATDGTARWSYTAEGEVGPPSLGAFGSVAFTSRSADRLYLLGR